MTETTANTEHTAKTDWLACAVAPFLAPGMVAMVGVSLAVVTTPVDAILGASALALVLAPFFELKTYLLFGAPLYLADLKLIGRNGAHVVENVGFGCYVAPIWSYALGLIYRGLSNA